jgi:hypothetical protein
LIDLADRRHPLFDLGESLFVGAPVAVAAPIARRFDDVGHARALLTLRMLPAKLTKFVCVPGFSDVLISGALRAP